MASNIATGSDHEKHQSYSTQLLLAMQPIVALGVLDDNEQDCNHGLQSTLIPIVATAPPQRNLSGLKVLLDTDFEPL